MSELRKAAELAFDALDIYREHDAENIGLADAAYEALRQALAQPEQEQYVTKVVAMHEDGTYTTERIPLPKREWVGLTDEEIEECKINGGLPHAINWRLSVKVMEAKLKEKNT